MLPGDDGRVLDPPDGQREGDSIPSVRYVPVEGEGNWSRANPPKERLYLDKQSGCDSLAQSG
jgi:hypothetical protein